MISNQTRAARSFDFEITRMISDQIALHSVQLPLLILPNCISADYIGDITPGHCLQGLGEQFRLIQICLDALPKPIHLQKCLVSTS